MFGAIQDPKITPLYITTGAGHIIPPYSPEGLYNNYGKHTPETDFIDSKAVYASNEGTDNLLDLSRKIINAGNYYPSIMGWPIGPLSALTIPALGTLEGSIQVPAKSILVSLSIYTRRTAGGVVGDLMRVTISDKGSSLGITAAPGTLAALYMSRMDVDTTLVPGDPFGPGYLIDPIYITDPGQVQITIANTMAFDNIVQIAMSFAVPINNLSVNTPVIYGLGQDSREGVTY